MRDALGAAPSDDAAYRFTRKLREHNANLTSCIETVLAALHGIKPEMGQVIAIDGSDLPAYANGLKHVGNKNGPQRAILVTDVLVPVGVGGKVGPVDGDYLTHFRLDAVERGKHGLNAGGQVGVVLAQFPGEPVGGVIAGGRAQRVPHTVVRSRLRIQARHAETSDCSALSTQVRG